MSSSNGSGRSPAPHPDDVPRSGFVLRMLAVIGVFTTVALFGFLIVFAVVGGDTRNPDELDQIGFPADVEPICAEHQAAIETLPSAGEIEGPEQRADVLDEANEILDEMIVTLRADVAGRDVVDDLPDARSSSLSPGDQAIVDAGTLSTTDADNLDQWLTDYETYLADRMAHSVRLRSEGDVRFLVSGKDDAHVTEFVDGYARVNDMESCASPRDLG